MTDDPNQPTQYIAGGDIHHDNRRYEAHRDMYNAERDINVHHHYPQQEVSYPFYDIPHAQNPNFTGREAVLAELHTQLRQQQTTTVTQTIAGLGGVGKTQLAVEYAHRHKADYDIVAWLGADNEPLLGNDVVMLGQALQLVQPPVTDQNAAIQMVRRWLGSTDKRWLLLVDNADTLPPRTVMSCLPTTGNGRILITSRNPNWGGVGAVLRLDVFTPTEAEDFLRRRLGNVDAAECAALAQTLGYFPLALEHAAAFIEEKQCGVAAYRSYFTEQRQQLWAALEPPNAYHATITTTWELAFQEIKKTAGAVEVLNLCAFLSPEGIQLELLNQVREKPKSSLKKLFRHALNKPQFLWDDPLALDEAIATLHRYSLLLRDREMIIIHRVMQIVVRDRMNTNQTQTWLTTAVDLMEKVWPFDQYKMDTWNISSNYLSHLLTVIQLSNESNLVTEVIATLNNKAGFYLSHFGNLSEAQPYYERGLAIYELVLGPAHVHTATSLNNMGSLLKTRGEYELALSYFERSLAVRENVLGSEHPKTATSLSNLASLFEDMEDYDKAHKYYERALTINKNVLGEDHPDTALSLSNLASLLYKMGEFETSQVYLRKALDISANNFRTEFPDTATNLNNLGWLLQGMGEYEVAYEYYRRALNTDQKVLETEHPDTAISLGNLGWLLKEMGEYEAAKPYLKRALAIHEKKLGVEHPTTAQTLNILGLLHQALEEYNSAKLYFERALSIWENKLGTEHPRTKMARKNLAKLEQILSSSE